MNETMYVPMPTNTGFGGDNLGSLLIGALLFGGNRFGGGFGGWGGGWGGYGGSPAASAVATDVLLNPAFQSLQNQVQTLSNQMNQNQISDQIGTLGSEINGEFRRVNQAVDSGNTNTLQSIASVATAQAAANFTTLQSLNGVQAAITAQNNQEALQNLNSFNQLNTTVLQGFNNQQFQSAQYLNQIIAQGTQNAAAMANCCCEIKQSIAADGNATRALINQLDKERLTSELNDAKGQLSNSNQTNALINAMAQNTATIINHLAPKKGNS